MPRARIVPADHTAFVPLPVTRVTIEAGRQLAVHVSGSLSSRSIPLVCIAGYQRNMSDFTQLASAYVGRSGADAAVVLIDLAGRGRSDDRRQASDYSTLADARDVAAAVAALGIGRAVFLGQGHGGHVLMALAAQHPLLFAGTILVDAGPVIDPRGIVRLRNNIEHLDKLRGTAVDAGFRRILGGDYPGLPDEQMPILMARSHYLDKRRRTRPLFDPRLITALAGINFDDVLAPQWALFDALTCGPLMLLRTQLTDQLHRHTFDQMNRRRDDIVALTLAGQGSPALFNEAEEIDAVIQFAAGARLGRAKAA